MKSIINREKYDYKSVKYIELKNEENSHLSETDSDCDQSLNDFPESSESSRNRFELKNRQNDSNRKSEPLVEYINYEVKPEESLRTIALRYGCSVSTIKRINHLMSDHEFYALRVIKLPVKKFGILSNVLVHQINSQSETNDNIAQEREDQLSHETNQRNGSLTVNIGISQHLSHTDSESAFKFLNHMDEDLKKIRQSTKTVIESSKIDDLNRIQMNGILGECDNPIAIQTLPNQKRSAFFTCDESDYGINWFNLLIMAFVLCVLVPIVYVIYISEHINHNNTVSDFHKH